MLKSFSVVLMIMVMFVIGCAAGPGQFQISVDQESQELIAKIAGRHAGNELAKRHLDIAQKVEVVCQNIISEENPDIVVSLTKSVIIMLTDDNIKDPLLKADIKDILDKIKVKTGIVITESQMAVTKAVAEGLIDGIGLAIK